MSDSGTPHYSTVSLKLLPAYLGPDSIEAALATARRRRMGPIDFASIAPSPRRSTLPTITTERLIDRRGLDPFQSGSVAP